jgi:hypothetical protein
LILLVIVRAIKPGLHQALHRAGRACHNSSGSAACKACKGLPEEAAKDDAKDDKQGEDMGVADMRLW